MDVTNEAGELVATDNFTRQCPELDCGVTIRYVDGKPVSPHGCTTCPERGGHGNPFRYCGVRGCGWMEPTPPKPTYPAETTISGIPASEINVSPTPLASLLTASKLRWIAERMDELDRRRGTSDTPGENAMQTDLRAWADGLETGTIA